MEFKKNILVAPLNWGLGHAARCIPLINALIESNFNPIIASDGMALELLNKEFPNLEMIALPSYNIKYPKSGNNLKSKLIKHSPRIVKAIIAENKIIEELVTNNKIDGIISDNRLGVYHKNIPSVFMSHQLNVLSGSTTWISSKLHQQIIKKYDECWVPDVETNPNLSGKLGHLKQSKIKIKYIGPLSRFNLLECNTNNDLLVILSGPEPQRSILEELLLEELKRFEKSVIFVRGIVEKTQNIQKKDNLIVYNYMTSHELEMSVNQSRLVLSRSGYTTIMDLVKLKKKAFFIPTPGQYEQEYLAERLDKHKLVPFCNQDEFKIEMLQKVDTYKGLHAIESLENYSELFSLFQCERKLATNT